jgi:hypothetical protein
VGLKLNGTHQLPVYADDVHLLGGNTETLIDTSKEVGLEVNAEKAKVYVAVLSPECRAKSRHKDS